MGKVFIVTGGAVGIGFELVKMLYEKNGTVYIATRSREKISRAINQIQQVHPTSHGKMMPLKFLASETRLDVLFHNASVTATSVGSKSAQGHELQMATNDLAHITQHGPKSPTDRVRIVWVSSMVGLGTPQGGIVWDEKAKQLTLLPDTLDNYMQSKVGMVFLAHNFAQRLGKEGVLSMGAVMKGPKNGAYTEIFAGYSPEVKTENNGAFIIPWGRMGSLPDHVAAGVKSKTKGGTGASETFWDWCEGAVKVF
ncbi:uncharacterized protein BCR38DRAFT_456016 [Pseudomassariella vexata]|uniref:NAD(P)-binding protein n=1 Tax=Pseudomassariella vexata TaxID=1141098 RepID=A0A1Y2E8I9_9PEZI|nr:uncharacterized protein BCR38DRAFT_456016 [Pseudomassariella vexata]ORY67175.1 hypothetical protein BCR38DRAFT_456016 [Pseudomassariella vexata]